MAVEQTLDLAKLGAGIAIGFGAIGGGLGLIKAEAFKNFIIGAGLAEATAIYALFIAIMLLFSK